MFELLKSEAGAFKLNLCSQQNFRSGIELARQGPRIPHGPARRGIAKGGRPLQPGHCRCLASVGRQEPPTFDCSNSQLPAYHPERGRS